MKRIAIIFNFLFTHKSLLQKRVHQWRKILKQLRIQKSWDFSRLSFWVKQFLFQNSNYTFCIRLYSFVFLCIFKVFNQQRKMQSLKLSFAKAVYISYNSYHIIPNKRTVRPRYYYFLIVIYAIYFFI